MPRAGNARSWRRPGTAPSTPAESCYHTAPMSTWAHRPSDLRWHWGNAYVITHPELDIWLAQPQRDQRLAQDMLHRLAHRLDGRLRLRGVLPAAGCPR